MHFHWTEPMLGKACECSFGRVGYYLQPGTGNPRALALALAELAISCCYVCIIRSSAVYCERYQNLAFQIFRGAPQAAA
jgi:hypothetical protein